MRIFLFFIKSIFNSKKNKWLKAKKLTYYCNMILWYILLSYVRIIICKPCYEKYNRSYIFNNRIIKSYIYYILLFINNNIY